MSTDFFSQAHDVIQLARYADAEPDDVILRRLTASKSEETWLEMQLDLSGNWREGARKTWNRIRRSGAPQTDIDETRERLKKLQRVKQEVDRLEGQLQAKDDVDRLLVYAFLRDLRYNHRRGLRPWRGWPRTTQCAVVLDEVTDETGGTPLCWHIDEIREESGLSDPLLIVGNASFELPWELDEAKADRPLSANYKSWQQGGREQHVSAHRLNDPLCLHQHVRLDEDRDRQEGGSAGRAPDSAPPRLRFRPRPRLSRPWVLGVLLVALIPGPLAASYAWRAQSHCHAGWLTNPDGVVRIDGECIGLAAPGYAFVQPEPEVTLGKGASTHQVTLAEVQELIYEENTRVVEADRPYVTAVYLNPITQANDSIVRELMGVYLAQRHHNSGGQPDPLLRILLANGGTGNAHELAAARQIVTAAESDPTVVGVIGVGRTHPGVRKTVQTLSAAALPIVATTNSSQRLHGSSAFYFHIAPTNGRQARVAAAYTRTLAVEHGAVIVDTREPYSRQLARLYRKGLTGAGLGKRFRRYEYPGGGVARNVLAARARAACRRSGGDLDLIYYAGRAQDLPSLFAGLTGTRCSTQGQRITVLGGDDLSKFRGRVPRLFRLRYTTLTYPPIWRCLSNMPASGLSPMYGEYERVFEGGYSRGIDDPTLADGHAALGYDATWAIARAAKAARAQRVVIGAAGIDKTEVTRPGAIAVWHELGGLAFNGATGWIDLRTQWRGGAMATRHGSWPRAVTLVEVGRGGRRTVEAAGEPLLPKRKARFLAPAHAPPGCPTSPRR